MGLGQSHAALQGSTRVGFWVPRPRNNLGLTVAGLWFQWAPLLVPLKWPLQGLVCCSVSALLCHLSRLSSLPPGALTSPFILCIPSEIN